MKKMLKSSLSFLLAITIIFGSAYVGLSEVDFSGFFAVKAEAAKTDLVIDTEYTVTSGTTKIFIPEVSGNYKFESNGVGDPKITIICYGGKFSFDDNNKRDFSGTVYLVAGEEVSCYLYNYTDNADCIFTITKGKDAKNISLTLAKPIEVIENYNGCYEEWQNPDTEEWEVKFFYEGYNFSADGNMLTVEYTDGTSVDYTYSWCETHYKWAWRDSECNTITNITCYDHQSITPWTKGGDNYIVVKYMDKETRVPVSVIDNPVESIEFTPEEPYEYIEKTGGSFDEWYNSDTQELEIRYFYKWYGIDYYGNVLTVNYKDGTSVDYTYGYNDYYKTTAWNDSEDNMIRPDEVSCCDYQSQIPWMIGADNYIVVRYLGKEVQVPVSIVENPVESVEFNTPKPIEIVEETNGYWDEFYNPETGEYDEYYCYYYSRYIYQTGNTLIINFKDGTREIYACNGWSFSNSAREELDITYDAPQSYTERWVVGSNNSFYLTLTDYGFEIEVPVTITENKNEGITFIPVEPLVVEEYTGGCWSTYYDKSIPGYKSYYDYDVVNMVEKEGNIINIGHIDGTGENYIYNDELRGFYNNENEKLDIVIDKSTMYWSVGDNNTFTLSAEEMSCKVSVTIVETTSNIINDDSFAAEIISDDSCIIIDVIKNSSSLTIPETVKGYNVIGIEDGVLGDYYWLTDVTLPSTFTMISENTFDNCENLSAIYVSENNEMFASVDGVLYNKALTEILFFPQAFRGTLIIKAGVTDIPESVVAYLGRGASVEIEEGNTAFVVEDGVLYNSTFTTIYKAYSVGAEHIMKPTVTKVAEQAFKELSNLESITFSAGVTEISYATFFGCYSLANVELPEALVSIGAKAFERCGSLTEIDFNDKLRVIEDQAFFNTGLTSVKLTDSITDISGAFSYCKGLTEVTVPDSVVYMDYAFSGCVNLEFVAVGSGVESMQGAFSGCTNLESVRLAEGLDCASKYAFAGCEKLQEIAIPSSVTELAYNQFIGCETLETIDVPETLYKVQWCALDDTAWYENQAEGVTYLEHILYDYKGTMPDNCAITVKNGTTAIAESAFANQMKLTEVQLPGGLKYIGDNAFDGCLSLKSIIIPESVEYIGEYSLGYDYNDGRDIYKYPDFTIYGVEYSVADHYAEENGFTFVAIAGEHTCVAGDWIYDQEPTCTDYGKRHNECTICGEVLKTQTHNPLGHNYSTEWTIDIEPTQSSDGEKSRHCINCSQRIDITPIPRLTNNNVAYIETRGVLCNGEISYIVKLKAGDKLKGAIFGAVFDPEVLEPIDEKSGGYTITNSYGDEALNVNGIYVAGMKYGSDDTYVVGHINMTELDIASDTEYMVFTFKVKDFSASEANVDFYCVEFNGTPEIEHNDYQVVTAYCKNDIVELNHTKSSEWKIEKEADAVEEGLQYKDCTVCGEVLETDVIPQTICEKPVITAVEQTDVGLVVVWDSVYGADIYDLYRKINSNWVKISQLTAENTSYTDAAVVNDTEYSYAVKAINEVGESQLSDIVSKVYHVHTMGDWLVRIAPTCTEYGESYRKCAGCEYEETDVIEPKGHSHSSEWTIDLEPTCTEEGSKSHHCTACDDKADVTVIVSLGHEYDNGVVTKPATCEEEGVIAFTCTRKGCIDSYTDIVPEIGHAYNSGNVVLAATCEEDGTMRYSCQNEGCLSYYDEVITRLGHDMDDGTITREPTCIAEGEKVYKCRNTGCLHEVTEAIEMVDHSYSDVWIIDIEATCTENGSKSHHCTVCGDKADITEIVATGHSYVLKGTLSVHPHTSTYICSACDDEKEKVNTQSGCVECNFTITPVDSTGYKLVSYIGSETDVTIPTEYNGRTITTIANACFRNNTVITSVKIAGGVTTIGSLAFMNCKSLERVYIPSSVTSIGAQAFYGFTGTIYCVSGSTAHEYAVANNIAYVLVSITETENTEIDYDNLVIRTTVQNCGDITEILGVAQTAIAIPTASYIYGNIELFGTGTIVTVFDGNEYIGDFTLVVEGDINGDSVCDALDAWQVAKASNGHETLDGVYALAADSNGDEEIDVIDYQSIVNKAVA